jgi:hypothetical protein
MMRALVACLLLFAAPAWAAPPTGSVRSVRRQLVYVDLGRSHGVRPGDVLDLEGSRAKLEVVHLGEKQLAAKRVGAGEVRVGARVTAPREPAAAAEKRPVVQLAPPRPAPAALPWSGDPLRRAELVRAPAMARVEAPSGARGEIRVTYVGLLDQSASDLDLHQAEVRSKLALDAGGGLTYRHDVAGRVELGPDLDRRSGSDSRPYYRVRLLELGWSSSGWSDAPEARAAGAVDAALGRLHLFESPRAGLLDGLRAELALGRGFSAGLHGGLVPRLLDTAPSTDMALVGGHASWATAGEVWQARASLTTATSFWQGAMNRVDLGASGSLARGRDFDLYALAVATLVDPSLLADQRELGLSRAFVGTRVRPLDWLTLDAHYAHDRIVADRELLALLGADRLVTDPRESAWLQVRFDAVPDVSLWFSGSYGFGSDSAEYLGADARLALRDLFVEGLRVALGYRYGRSPATETHAPHVDLSLALGSAFELGLGYGFATFRSRLLDERQDEHRLDAGFDVLAAGPWRVHLRGTYAFGTLPSQLGMLAQLAWRFR